MVTTSASGTLLRARERCGDQSRDGRVRRDEHVAAAETRVNEPFSQAPCSTAALGDQNSYIQVSGQRRVFFTTISFSLTPHPHPPAARLDDVFYITACSAPQPPSLLQLCVRQSP